jgi:hypothetical protein
MEAEAFKGEDYETPEDNMIQTLSRQYEDEDEEDKEGDEDKNEEDEEEEDEGDDDDDGEEYNASSVWELNEANTRNCDELPESSQRAPRELPESSQRAPELPSMTMTTISGALIIQWKHWLGHDDEEFWLPT